MMVTNIKIMTCVKISVANKHNAIINDLLSDGLSSLERITQDDIKCACSRYYKRIYSHFFNNSHTFCETKDLLTSDVGT